jgi:hypothetical protein
VEFLAGNRLWFGWWGIPIFTLIEPFLGVATPRVIPLIRYPRFHFDNHFHWMNPEFRSGARACQETGGCSPYLRHMDAAMRRLSCRLL